MSIEAQAWVYRWSKARLADRLVLLAIADEADDDGNNAFPSQRRIAEKALVGQSTVRRCVENLERLGELVVERPETTGRGKFNRYRMPMGRPQEGTEIEHLPGPGNAPERAGTRRNAPSMDGAYPLTPLPPDQERDGADALVARVGQIKGKAQEKEACEALARDILKGWWEALMPRPTQHYLGAVKIIDTALRAGHDPDDVRAVLGPIVPPLTQGNLEVQLRRRNPGRKVAGTPSRNESLA